MIGLIEPANMDLLKKAGFKNAHEIEVAKDQVIETNWPAPQKCYRLIHESWKHSREEAYYWLLNYMRYDIGYSIVHKVTDLFSASEQSSFFGLGQQRIGLQQDKVSSFLAIIGKMTKELFQLVREMRILDERLSFYIASEKRDKRVFAVKQVTPENRAWESAEITLKGYWVDLVEQGSKNPASVYGMAREVQFTTLPDLFFSIHPFSDDLVDAACETPEFERAFNRKVREVLKRKLRTYLAWKKETYKELLSKRGFTLRYMYQHVHIVKLYMSYVKPYLKNIQRMLLDERFNDSPDLVAAFESAMVEVEILGQHLPTGGNYAEANKVYWSCFDLHFLFKTKPSLNYNAEGYNRGPIHEGLAEITYRTYVWTQKQIDSYLKMRDREDFELMKVIDKNLEFAMEELGEDLFKYLDEVEQVMITKYKDSGYEKYSKAVGINKKEQKEPEKKKQGGSDPFSALFGGFKEVADAFKPKKKGKEGKDEEEEVKLDSVQIKAEQERAKRDSGQKSWLAYKNYKKGHNMITW